MARDARQQAFDQMHRPAFKRLWQQRMVGIGRCGAGNFPGLFPSHVMLIDKQAHKFRNGNGRVRVIQLNGRLVSEIQYAAKLVDMAPDKILQ